MYLFPVQENQRVELVDVKFCHRVIPLSRRGHVTGWHPVRPGHAQIPFESRLERDAISWLAAAEEFESIQSQPLTITFRDEQEIRRYTPDFLVSFAQGSTPPTRCGRIPWHCFLVEVKYEQDWCQHEARAALQIHAAIQATQHPLVVLTERDVRPAIKGRRHE
jgi:hypothetical protein